VDISKNDLIGWDAKVPTWRAVKSMTFHDMIGTCIVLCVFTILSLNFEYLYFSSLSVPTVDSVRNSFVVDALLKIKRNVLLVGATGTGKTVLAQSLLRDLPETHSQLVLNFSAATTSSAVQDIGTLTCLLIRNFLDKVIMD